MHSTQRGASQKGVAPPPSALQSALLVHAGSASHRPVVVSQTGVSRLLARHCASVVHPATQVWKSASHTGRAVGQSLFASHWTHVADAVSHTAPAGLPLQSASAWHWTHCCVVASQTALPAVFLQSSAVRHPTHAPVVMSQMGVRPPPQAAPPSARHEAWHV
jgi:hypothetical protein